MIKRISIIFFFAAVLLLYPSFFVSADFMNPSFYAKKCDIGEEMVKCDYRSDEPFGPHTVDECKKYANNPNYRYLSGAGGSFGGTEKYCRIIGASDGGYQAYIFALGAGVMMSALVSYALLKRLKKKMGYSAS